ncbi:MAG: hypothetical protein GY749_17250 [Desulfobacteraceae bacterium]|nr:hypothetical protein [Desulfobacteraceae bacterium]
MFTYKASFVVLKLSCFDCDRRVMEVPRNDSIISVSYINYRHFGNAPFPTSHFPLPTSHFPLLTSHFSLPTSLTSHFSLPTSHFYRGCEWIKIRLWLFFSLPAGEEKSQKA